MFTVRIRRDFLSVPALGGGVTAIDVCGWTAPDWLPLEPRDWPRLRLRRTHRTYSTTRISLSNVIARRFRAGINRDARRSEGGSPVRNVRPSDVDNPFQVRLFPSVSAFSKPTGRLILYPRMSAKFRLPASVERNLIYRCHLLHTSSNWVMLRV